MSEMTRLSRRDLLLAAGSLSLLGVPDGVQADNAPPQNLALPDRAAFAPMEVTYLDSGSFHPISLGARAAIDRYLARRTLDARASDKGVEDGDVLAKFARLVNADPDEVAFVQSTTTGEQMVLRALGIPDAGGHIITDTLHFFGSFPLYEEMSRRGMQVTWLRPVEGRIRIEEMKQSLRKDTKLMALSLVSTFNGFEHDLKAVCDLAHANGTLVYADIIHAAGCMPVDLHASGVDFAACASYKWLMGDFGLGFIYARRELQPKLKRCNFGYYGIAKFEPHAYPLDPPGNSIADYQFENSATGAFALGTHGESVMAQLDYSLDYLDRLGVANIQKHAQSLVGRLKTELPRLGYPLLTPPESPTPLVTCLYRDARTALAPRLKAGKVRLTLGANRFRISVSVFNTMQDLDRLLSVLGHA
jgi:selenocysteine lyase/cysteine desulfurase